jgi:hypothetical protein
MMMVGGRDEKVSLVLAEPMSAVSSSFTILMNCWAGVRLSSTSAPKARALTLSTNSLTTL